MCCCCCRGVGHDHHRYPSRRFLTRDEEAKDLEEYADDLKKELAALEERINELRR